MRKETVEVYKFDELDEEAQEKAIENHRRINVRHDWYDFILEDFKREAEEELGIKVDTDKIEFDLYRGRNFQVNTSGIIMPTELADFSTIVVYTELDNQLNAVGVGFSDFPVRQWRRTPTRALDVVEVTKDGNIINPESEQFQKVEREMKKRFEDFVDLCREYYNRLEESYHSLQEDESVANTLRVNDYEFKENGERWT